LDIKLSKNLRDISIYVADQHTHTDEIRFVCLFLELQPPVGQGLLIHEVSRSHTTTHYRR